MRVEGSLSVCLSAVYLIICEHICAFVMKDKIFDGIKPIFWFNDDNINDDAAHGFFLHSLSGDFRIPSRWKKKSFIIGKKANRDGGTSEKLN